MLVLLPCCALVYWLAGVLLSGLFLYYNYAFCFHLFCFTCGIYFMLWPFNLGYNLGCVDCILCPSCNHTYVLYTKDAIQVDVSNI